MDVIELTAGRTVHFTVAAREALLSLLSSYQWYIGDSVAGPALTFCVEGKVLQQYLINRNGYSTRPGYWQVDTIPFVAKVLGIEYGSLSYATKKLRILYSTGWNTAQYLM